MVEKNDNNNNNKAELSVDEQAKQQFLEELKNKNLEETKELEELKNKEEQAKLENDQKLAIKSEIDNLDKKIPNDDKFNVKRKIVFLPRSLKSSIIDTVVTALVSLGALYLLDLILRLIFGYYVADMKGMFIVLFIIVLILYPFIMSSCKYKETLGQKFSKTVKVERKD